jgi:hypothetical protein
MTSQPVDALVHLAITEDQKIYNKGMFDIFNWSVPGPVHPLSCSLDPSSSQGIQVTAFFRKMAFQFEQQILLGTTDFSILRNLRPEILRGCLIEFGVYKGERIASWFEALEKSEFDQIPLVYGFDSFEGLPKPSLEYDYPFWKEGDFSDVDYEEVKSRLKVKSRSNLRLEKGLFADTFKKQNILEISNITFVVIDCDIYQPTLDCLNFVTDRIGDFAIIGFDDWSYNANFGESRAFFEWAENIKPTFDFTFLVAFGWRFYILLQRREI